MGGRYCQGRYYNHLKLKIALSVPERFKLLIRATSNLEIGVEKSMAPRPIPNATIAKSIAAKVVGEMPIAVRQFTTGSHHYVFEAIFPSNSPVVVRIAAEHSRSAMIGASTLSHRLRPLGVPLPKIIAEDLAAEFAYIVLERLPGRDLRDVIGHIDNEWTRAVAGRIVDAQNVVSHIPSAGRYGFAVEPQGAPYKRWS